MSQNQLWPIGSNDYKSHIRLLGKQNLMKRLDPRCIPKVHDHCTTITQSSVVHVTLMNFIIQRTLMFAFNYKNKILKREWKLKGEKICSSKPSSYQWCWNSIFWHNLQHTNLDDIPNAFTLSILSLVWNKFSILGTKKQVKWSGKLVHYKI
jgi:hypothetical protein